jgi:hypothetical protein
MVAAATETSSQGTWDGDAASYSDQWLEDSGLDAVGHNGQRMGTERHAAGGGMKRLRCLDLAAEHVLAAAHDLTTSPV